MKGFKSIGESIDVVLQYTVHDFMLSIEFKKYFSVFLRSEAGPSYYHKLTYYHKLNYEKSHTCEEGGANFRISFWHLLMNLKNKLLLKKLLKWVNKSKITLIFTIVAFFKKI